MIYIEIKKWDEYITVANILREELDISCHYGVTHIDKWGELNKLSSNYKGANSSFGTIYIYYDEIMFNIHTGKTGTPGGNKY